MAAGASVSDFGKDVGKVFRGIKDTFEKHPVKDGSAPSATSQGPEPVDRSVKEQVLSDLDKLIERHEK